MPYLGFKLASEESAEPVLARFVAPFIRRLLLLLAVLGFVQAATGLVLGAERKVALVIGNSAYRHVPHLPNPRADALAMSQAFERLGFDVTLANDVDVTELRRRLADFALKSVGADISAIFYAGHGIEVDGQNYIIPVDARLKNVVVVGFELISLDTIISSMQPSKGLKLVFLDACRDNPFRQTMRKGSTTRSIGRGLATVEPDSGMVISYAAKAGTIAYDGEGQHSPYTAALLKNMEEPGLELQFLFRRVRDEVIRKTKRQQEPFFYGSLPDREFYLNPPSINVGRKPLPKSSDVESTDIDEAAVAWRLVQGSADPEDIKAFLTQYGAKNRFYERLAQKRLNAIVKLEVAAKKQFDNTKVAIQSEKTDKSTGSSLQQQSLQEPSERKIIANSGTSNLSENRTTNRLAALPSVPIDLPTPVEITKSALIRSVQTELNKIGCNAGKPDGKWGRNSRRALRRYFESAELEFASLDPSKDVLTSLLDNEDVHCPLDCPSSQVLEGNQCVAKKCPSGMSLSRDGNCYVLKQKRVIRCAVGQKKNSAGKCYWPKRKTAKKKIPTRQKAKAPVQIKVRKKPKTSGKSVTFKGDNNKCRGGDC